MRHLAGGERVGGGGVIATSIEEGRSSDALLVISESKSDLLWLIEVAGASQVAIPARLISNGTIHTSIRLLLITLTFEPIL